MISAPLAAGPAKVAPVSKDQHVATVTYRTKDGSVEHAQPLVANDAPAGIGFAFAGYPKLDDAVREARAASEGLGGATGVFALDGKRFGFAGLNFSMFGGGSDAPQGISAGEQAHLGISNLGWSPDLDVVDAKRATKSLLMIVDGTQTIDLRDQKPIASITDESGHPHGVL